MMVLRAIEWRALGAILKGDVGLGCVARLCEDAPESVAGVLRTACERLRAEPMADPLPDPIGRTAEHGLEEYRRLSDGSYQLWSHWEAGQVIQAGPQKIRAVHQYQPRGEVYGKFQVWESDGSHYVGTGRQAQIADGIVDSGATAVTVAQRNTLVIAIEATSAICGVIPASAIGTFVRDAAWRKKLDANGKIWAKNAREWFETDPRK